MSETWVLSLGGEDPLEEEMATYSSIPAKVTSGQRHLVGYSIQGCKELDTTEQLRHHACTQIYKHPVNLLRITNFLKIHQNHGTANS